MEGVRPVVFIVTVDLMVVVVLVTVVLAAFFFADGRPIMIPPLVIVGAFLGCEVAVVTAFV